MLQRVDLFLHLPVDRVVAVADADRHNAAEKVQILVTVGIPYELIPGARKHQRLSKIVENCGENVSLLGENQVLLVHVCSVLHYIEVTSQEFDRLVERALERIPARFRRRLENIVFVVEPEPPRRGLLGLYQGRPLTERSVSEGFRLPDQITIYQGPHERMARDLQELEEMVADTVWHEIAHYFGMDERRVRRAERARRRRRPA
jgi:predicted Zn-dependent protease with MMP-like domain